VGAVAATVVAGCTNPSQELAVRFRASPGTTDPDPAQVQAARAACPGSGAVRLRPVATTTLVSARRVPLRYDVTGSTDREVALVQECLERQPGVDSFYLQRRSG